MQEKGLQLERAGENGDESIPFFHYKKDQF